MKKTILIPVAVLAALLIAGLLWKTNSPASSAETATASPLETPSTLLPATETSEPTTISSNPTDGIRWVSWDEAVKAHEQSPKMLFVDVYTDWCGWCKVMDKQTFTDPEVIKYINDHYYAVKFNAENEPTIVFRGQEFKMVSGGRRGIHTLAYSLLEGELSYPSYVYLNADFQRVNISKGFKPAEPFLAEMRAVTQAHLE